MPRHLVRRSDGRRAPVRCGTPGWCGRTSGAQPGMGWRPRSSPTIAATTDRWWTTCWSWSSSCGRSRIGWAAAPNWTASGDHRGGRFLPAPARPGCRRRRPARRRGPARTGVARRSAAMSEVTVDLTNFLRRHGASLIDFRRDLHRHPEPSYAEHVTTDKICNWLRASGFAPDGALPRGGADLRHRAWRWTGGGAACRHRCARHG